MRKDSITLLRRNSHVRALVASRWVSSSGTWLAYVALIVDVYARTHSSIWVSAVLLADFGPSVAIATLFGPSLDRLPRRRLLVGSELTAGLAFAALPFAPSATAVVALALAAGCASAVFYPTLRATMPLLVEPDELPRANSLSQTAGNSGMAAGPALAGVLVASSGVAAPYLLNAVSFAISALLLARLPSLRASAERDAEPYWRTAVAGFRTCVESGPLQRVVRIWVLASLAGAAVNVGEIFLARQTFHAGTIGYGLLASASGGGVVAGSVLAGRATADAALRWCRLGLVWTAVGFALAALAPSIWLAAACAAVGGVGNAVFLAASTLLVQKETHDGNRAHVFAIFDAAGFAAIGVGMVGGGIVIGALGARGAWLVAAGVAALAAAATAERPRARAARTLLHAEAEVS